MKTSTKYHISLIIIISFCALAFIVLANAAMWQLASHEWSNPIFYRLALTAYSGKPDFPSQIPSDASEVSFHYSPQLLQAPTELTIGFKSEAAESLTEDFRSSELVGETEHHLVKQLEDKLVKACTELYGEGEFEAYIAEYDGINHATIRAVVYDADRNIAYFYYRNG